MPSQSDSPGKTIIYASIAYSMAVLNLAARLKAVRTGFSKVGQALVSYGSPRISLS
jgi:hypothetical protein